ncbi:MAG: SulP family inorganic anion transporter [Candidatus Nanopelagicales bacterium]
MFTLLRGYTPSWLRGDVVAGVTVAAIAIPESLGYASIAGMPAQAGLYCALLPPLLFAIIASSRQLVVGADSATAALVAAGATAVAATGSSEYAGAVAVLGIVTAVVLLVMAVARLGFLADLISQPVLAGFLSGVGVSLIIGKLPDVLGIPASGSTWNKLVDTVTGLGSINWWSAALGLGVVAVMIGALRIPAAVPAALFGLIVFSVLGNLIDAESHGVAMVGALPPGLPSFAWPSISAGELGRLAATGLSIAFVVLAQSAAVARSFGTKNAYKVDTNSDLVGLAAANLGSAVTGGFAINGSPPRTAAGDGAGSKSQLVNIVMALVIGLLLVFGSGLFAYVPSTVLDGIVLGIGIHLLKIGELRAIYRARKDEFLAAMLALVVVAFVGVEQGVLLAVVVAIIERARRAYRPQDEVTLRAGVAGDRHRERFAPLPATSLEGVLVYRFDSPLFFANATHFDERLRAVVEETSPRPTLVIIDAAAMTDIDVTGVNVLTRLAHDLQAEGSTVVITELTPSAAQIVHDSALDQVATVVPRIEDALSR